YKTLPQLISSGEIEAKVEIIKRTALSLAPLIVGIIAFSIAVSIPRGSVGIGVITSLILIVSYYIVYTFSKKLALKTGHPLVAFTPDFVFGAVALFLYRKACEEKISVNVGARW
ncbi:MAG: LptF/LptG family permease, partial [Desulfurobacteriaceae bacterium]